MSNKPKVEFLPKYNLILSHSLCSYSDLTSALKLIFNIDSKEATELIKEASLNGSVVIETLHKEKLELRENQIKTWNEKGVSQLPIHSKSIIGE